MSIFHDPMRFTFGLAAACVLIAIFGLIIGASRPQAAAKQVASDPDTRKPQP